MSEAHEVRQDQAGEHRAHELPPEDDARRIEQLKASHQSHHAAGGCAEHLAKPAPTVDAGASSNGPVSR